MNNWHRYHPAQGNNHLSFVPQHYLMLVKDFKPIKLGMALNGFNSPIEGQRVCICHHLGSLQKKFRMLYMHKENYESNPKLCKQKLIPINPILEAFP